jgi:hypothetical protein
MSNPMNDNFDQEEMIDISKNILFIGASPKLFNKLHDIYINSKSLDFKATKISKKAIENSDGVVLLNHTTTNPYATYSKIKSIAEQCKVKYITITNNNIDLIVDTIEKTFK